MPTVLIFALGTGPPTTPPGLFLHHPPIASSGAVVVVVAAREGRAPHTHPRFQRHGSVLGIGPGWGGHRGSQLVLNFFAQIRHINFLYL